jgi:hypothetical protein
MQRRRNLCDGAAAGSKEKAAADKFVVKNSVRKDAKRQTERRKRRERERARNGFFSMLTLKTQFFFCPLRNW